MNPETLEKALEMAKRLGHIFVATADAKGLPHLAAAGQIEKNVDGRVSVSAWFFFFTRSNIVVNPQVALVIWDAETDSGYQLLGETEHVHDVSMLDGYSPEMEEAHHVPQVEAQMVVRVNRIVDFKHAPHTDEEA